MTKLNLEFQIYPYGKVWDMLKCEEDGSKKDFISIYVSPSTFTKVPLSSIEGYFIVLKDEYITENGTPFCFNTTTVPKLNVRRDELGDLERKFNGKFVPF